MTKNLKFAKFLGVFIGYLLFAFCLFAIYWGVSSVFEWQRKKNENFLSALYSQQIVTSKECWDMVYSGYTLFKFEGSRFRLHSTHCVKLGRIEKGDT